MSTHDYIIADASGSAFLADINLAVKALAENNSSATEPAVMYAHMWWADTTADILKKRNAANTGWISYLTLSTGALLGQGLGTPASGVLTNCTGMAAGLSIGGNASTATTSTNVTGSAVVTGAISSSSPSAGIGYATGAGVAVNQSAGGATPYNNTVTANGMCGTVQMNSPSSGGVDYGVPTVFSTTIYSHSFTFNNSYLGALDKLIITDFDHLGWSASITGTSAGTRSISLKSVNIVGSEEYSGGAIKFGFMVLKSVNS